MSEVAPNVYQFGPVSEATEEARRQSLVSNMHRMLQGGEQLKSFAGSFAIAMRDRIWEQTRRLDSGRTIEPISFRKFITEPYPVGLGAEREPVMALVAASSLPNKEEVAAQARAAWGVEVGGHGATDVARNETGKFQAARTGPCNTRSGEEGQYGTADYTRARLARDADPDKSRLDDGERERAASLLAEVDSGKRSCNSAAVEMGYRKRKTPLETAMAAWRKMDVSDQEHFLEWAQQNMRGVFDNTQSGSRDDHA